MIHRIAFGFLFYSCLLSTCEAADKPNVIVIFTDDHGFSDLQCQGIQDDLKTPHIDTLAAGGVRMTSGYVTAPQCVPSRAGLLSGRSQNRFGVESNGLPLTGFNDQSTIAERLKAVGYSTGMTGKWHLGPAPEIVNHGFDDVYFKNANRPGWANYDLEGNDCVPGPEHSKLYHLDANSAAACAFIDRHHDEPFFFYCAYRAPHVPLDAPPKYLDRFPGEMPERRRQALAMISAIDDGVGKIVERLRHHEIEESTLIFIIGDNGAPLKIHKLDTPGGGPGWDGSLNEPLNGEKGMLSEGGIRVPFLVYWKDKIPGARVYDHPVSSLDVAVTAVSLAGAAGNDLDGLNLVPYLTGKHEFTTPRTLYWRWIAQAAVREGKWKYLCGGDREYLFDLDADREEQHNLIFEHAAIASRLRRKLTAWSSELSPPGLKTNSMSSTWEDYYDFYLDGKPAPKQRAKLAADNEPSDVKPIQDWIARNAKLKLTAEGLVANPQGKLQRPFITVHRLKLPPKIIATVRMKAIGDGGFQWREQGQKDFSSEQVANLSSVVQGWQEHSVALAGTNEIIHLRLLLPPSGATISHIELCEENGKQLKRWDFN